MALNKTSQQVLYKAAITAILWAYTEKAGATYEFSEGILAISYKNNYYAYFVSRDFMFANVINKDTHEISMAKSRQPKWMVTMMDEVRKVDI